MGFSIKGLVCVWPSYSFNFTCKQQAIMIWLKEQDTYIHHVHVQIIPNPGNIHAC